MSKRRDEQRYRCPYCQKSWLTTAYDYSSHTLRCKLGPHVTYHPATVRAQQSGEYRGWKLFANRGRGRQPSRWRADAHGVSLSAASLPALLALLDTRLGNKMGPPAVSSSGRRRR